MGAEAPEVLQAFIQRVRRLGRVHVYPVLYGAGNHMHQDILGEDSQSLRSRLGVSDFTVGTVLGEKPWVRRHLIEQLRKVIAVLGF